MKIFNNTKYLVYVLTVTCLAYVLPLLWNISTADAMRYPFTYYSSLIDDFGYIDFENGHVQHKDTKGNLYTESEFDSILPMFSYRQLAVEGRLPDTIKGLPIDAKKIRTKAFFYRYRPRNKFSPYIGLYPLFESASRKVKIEMPGDVFRITKNEIEFIDPETNKLKPQKSKQFTRVLQELGYVGDPKMIAGTPSTRKPYDEGYLFIDQNDALFHMKMANGKPFIKKTKLPKGVDPVYLETTEYPDRRFYGFLIDSKNRLYFIKNTTYELVHVPTPQFSYTTSQLQLMGNLINWNVSATSKTGKTVWAIDTNTMQFKDSIVHARPARALENIPKYIFPATLHFTNTNHNFVKADLKFGGFSFLFLNVFLLLVYVIILKLKKQKLSLPALIGVATTGIYGFIAGLIIRI